MRRERVRAAIFAAVYVALLSGVCLLAYFVFGDPFGRIGKAGAYLWRCLCLVFAEDAKQIDPPTFQDGGDMGWMLGYASSFLYSLYAGFAFTFSAGGFAWALKEGLETMKAVFQIMVALPIAFLSLFLIKWLLFSGSDEEITADSRLVAAISKVWRKAKPVRSAIAGFLSWAKSSRLARLIFFCAGAWIFAASGLLSMALEAIGFYFAFCFSACGADPLKEIVSLFAQLLAIAMKLGWPFLSLLGAFVAWRLWRRSALNRLKRMQGANEEVADGLSVCTAITGAPGIGKTKMMTSIAVDLERSQREAAFSIIKKYASAFPWFDWPSLERWVEGEVGSRGLSNRAQIRAKLGAMYSKRADGGFFNYEPSRGEYFFDGARRISLGYAADCYAEAYFLYFPGLPLAVTNYSIRFTDTAAGFGYFPLYPSASAYLDGGCRYSEARESFSAIVDFDSRRIAKRIDESDVDAASGMDGQVEAYTEVDKERGNRNDYRGLKADGGANATNDGFNWSVKLTRHDFTIDGYPFTKILMDTQRPDSVNADLRETCEDSIFIYSKGPSENALPLFSYAKDLCALLVGIWEAAYYRIRAVRGPGRTCLTVCGNAISSAIRNWSLRMEKSYGYERVLFKHTVGAGTSFSGVSALEEYYFIKRKVESGLYATDCYRGLSDARKIESGKGYLDAARYTSTSMSVAEMKRQHSYFIDKLVDQTEKSILERRQKAQEEGERGAKEESDEDLQD